MYWLGRYLDPVTLTYILHSSDFDTFCVNIRYISSTTRPTTIKPCRVLLLNVLTRQIPWPGDLDLYFGWSDFDIMYVNVPGLLKCRISIHQTLHSASPRWTDLAGILTWWPWLIFCAPVPFIHFTLHSASPQCTYFDLVTLTYILHSIDFYTFYVAFPYVLSCKAFNHQTLYSGSSWCTDLANTLTWWPWPIFCTLVTLTHFTLIFDISYNP